MRLLSIILFSTLFVIESSSVFAADRNQKCFEHLEKVKLVGDSLSIYTNDSLVYHGKRPVINFTNSLLYMKVTDSTITKKVLIKFDDIEKITYRQPSRARHIIMLLGLGVGAVAGVEVGSNMAPESGALFDDIYYVGIGGMLGGFLGAVIGYQFSKNMTTQVTLECE